MGVGPGGPRFAECDAVTRVLRLFLSSLDRDDEPTPAGGEADDLCSPHGDATRGLLALGGLLPSLESGGPSLR